MTRALSLVDELVCTFERRIDAGELPPGARFPTEKAITAAAGVSRTVVREAFARLAARGLLVSRRGSGAYVAENALYRAFQVEPEDMIEVEDVVKLLEMRMALETEMAGLAAQRRTEGDLAWLGHCLERLGACSDVEQAVDADVAFHAAIARATHNEYYSRFMDFLGCGSCPDAHSICATRRPRSGLPMPVPSTGITKRSTQRSRRRIRGGRGTRRGGTCKRASSGTGC